MRKTIVIVALMLMACPEKSAQTAPPSALTLLADEQVGGVNIIVFRDEKRHTTCWSYLYRGGISCLRDEPIAK